MEGKLKQGLYAFDLKTNFGKLDGKIPSLTLNMASSNCYMLDINKTKASDILIAIIVHE